MAAERGDAAAAAAGSGVRARSLRTSCPADLALLPVVARDGTDRIGSPRRSADSGSATGPGMTRWARRSGPPGEKALEATPWVEMANGSEGKEGRAGPLSLKKEQEKRKKKNKKKKDYLNEDVNGFAAYLEQSLRAGEVAKAESAGLEKEVVVALKKDKRREDRRLKRQERKKNAMVCFHCREPGHGVADCPAVLESQDMGTGICYRCGSTEHDIGKCKAKVDPAVGAFPYAKCFICGEMGHLSRSCPDNPKGLYAEGGCCKLCGSVEHFRKDCPEKQNADQVTVGRWATGMSADYEEITEAPKMEKPKVKTPKVITF